MTQGCFLIPQDKERDSRSVRDGHKRFFCIFYAQFNIAACLSKCHAGSLYGWFFCNLKKCNYLHVRYNEEELTIFFLLDLFLLRFFRRHESVTFVRRTKMAEVNGFAKKTCSWVWFYRKSLRIGKENHLPYSFLWNLISPFPLSRVKAEKKPETLLAK